MLLFLLEEAKPKFTVSKMSGLAGVMITTKKLTTQDSGTHWYPIDKQGADALIDWLILNATFH